MTALGLADRDLYGEYGEPKFAPAKERRKRPMGLLEDPNIIDVDVEVGEIRDIVTQRTDRVLKGKSKGKQSQRVTILRPAANGHVFVVDEVV
jgi:hypothetical protein